MIINGFFYLSGDKSMQNMNENISDQTEIKNKCIAVNVFIISDYNGLFGLILFISRYSLVSFKICAFMCFMLIALW